MKKCKRCSSYAINHNSHGRDGSEPELCDVCYWRKKAEKNLICGNCGKVVSNLVYLYKT